MNRTAADLAESEKLRAKLAVSNARYYADACAAEHGYFSPEACEARMVERKAREALIAACDKLVELYSAQRKLDTVRALRHLRGRA